MTYYTCHSLETKKHFICRYHKYILYILFFQNICNKIIGWKCCCVIFIVVLQNCSCCLCRCVKSFSVCLFSCLVHFLFPVGSAYSSQPMPYGQVEFTHAQPAYPLWNLWTSSSLMHHLLAQPSNLRLHHHPRLDSAHISASISVCELGWIGSMYFKSRSRLTWFVYL